MEAKDILTGSDNDCIILNGDFHVGESDVQHVNDIISAMPGYYKQFPFLGVGIDLYLNSSGKEQQLENSIRLNMQSDGYDVSEVTVQSDNNTIDSNTKIYVNGKRINFT